MKILSLFILTLYSCIYYENDSFRIGTKISNLPFKEIEFFRIKKNKYEFENLFEIKSHLFNNNIKTYQTFTKQDFLKNKKKYILFFREYFNLVIDNKSKFFSVIEQNKIFVSFYERYVTKNLNFIYKYNAIEKIDRVIFIKFGYVPNLNTRQKINWYNITSKFYNKLIKNNITVQLKLKLKISFLFCDRFLFRGLNNYVNKNIKDILTLQKLNKKIGVCREVKFPWFSFTITTRICDFYLTLKTFDLCPNIYKNKYLVFLGKNKTEYKYDLYRGFARQNCKYIIYSDILLLISNYHNCNKEEFTFKEIDKIYKIISDGKNINSLKFIEPFFDQDEKHFISSKIDMKYIWNLEFKKNGNKLFQISLIDFSKNYKTLNQITAKFRNLL